jgi:hypothetical protein
MTIARASPLLYVSAARLYVTLTHPNTSFLTNLFLTNIGSQDLIDTNPRALDQVIWGLTHPNDVHPGVRNIVDNSALVDLLLIRHFKAHGGIALPPLKAARDLQSAYEIVAVQEAASGLTWTTGRTMMHYPFWFVEALIELV